VGLAAYTAQEWGVGKGGKGSQFDNLVRGDKPAGIIKPSVFAHLGSIAKF
jgi:hypothetical protein